MMMLKTNFVDNLVTTKVVIEKWLHDDITEYDVCFTVDTSIEATNNVLNDELIFFGRMA